MTMYRVCCNCCAPDSIEIGPTLAYKQAAFEAR